MKVKDCMSDSPQCVSPQTSLIDAAKLMAKDDFGFLPICEKDRLIGVVTDRDIAIRAVAEGKDLLKTTVRDIMTEKVSYCFLEDNISDACESMENKQIRRLIVLDENKRLKGIISLGDLATRSHNEHLYAEVLEHVSQTA